LVPEKTINSFPEKKKKNTDVMFCNSPDILSVKVGKATTMTQQNLA